MKDLRQAKIERYESDLSFGLTRFQVESREKAGLYNYGVRPKFKTKTQIFINNIFTYFNILNFLLALCVLMVGSLRNIFFIGVVVCNVFIGIVQEMKAMKTIKQLSIISQPKAHVIREGKSKEIDAYKLVLDDIIILEVGSQLATDVIIKDGVIEVDESLITGESDLVLKKSGDKIVSGSVVMSGRCIARVDSVAEGTYVSKILMAAGRYKDSRKDSQIMSYINIVVKIVAILIIPIGFFRFYKEYFLIHNSLQDAVVFTVASVIGMIPEGITLLTSITLMIGIIRLARLNVLSQDLFSLEALAKVDVLCLDKTGTLTQGDIEVEDIIAVAQHTKEEIYNIIYNFCRGAEDKSATLEGIKNFLRDKQYVSEDNWEIESRVYFSSVRKWSAVNFFGGKNIVLGAPEILFEKDAEKYSHLRRYFDDGKRIVVIGLSKEKLSTENKAEIEPVAFIIMSDKIRSNARETLDFFRSQGVEIKIISGDNAGAVSRIARRVGLDGSERYIDMTGKDTDEEIQEAINSYNVFGRTTPKQKQQLIRAYQKSGHTVGMIGDGVNDILALKESDCSIAIAKGSEAARQISKFVLLDCDFKSVPVMLNEGRRVINNIMRAASMFLIKNIYSVLLSVILLFAASSYPFMPVQLTLIGALTIGIPSFFLVLEENKEPIRKSFSKTVFKNALPPAIAIVVNILIINIINSYLGVFSQVQISTMAVILTGFCNLMELMKLSKMFHVKQRAIVLFFMVCFILSIVLFKDIFFLCSINLKMLTVIVILGIYSYCQINYCFKRESNSVSRS